MYRDHIRKYHLGMLGREKRIQEKKKKEKKRKRKNKELGITTGKENVII